MDLGDNADLFALYEKIREIYFLYEYEFIPPFLKIRFDCRNYYTETDQLVIFNSKFA